MTLLAPWAAGALAAYLYDLSDPVRLASATAETFRHGPITTGGFRFLCDGTRVEPPAR